jgi:hypothetical protein
MDEVIEKLQSIIQISQSGNKEKARKLFNRIIPLLGNDPLHNCIFAHYMADVQNELEKELYWDLKSLEYLDKLTDERLKQFNPTLNQKGFYASVYLNIAEDYRKSNMIESSKKYINLAEKSIHELDDNGYGNMIKQGIERIKEKIRNRTTAST